MHVAIVTHNIIKGDGQGRVNFELVRYLLNQNDRVDLIADNVASELVEAGATWHPVHPTSMTNLDKVWDFKRRASHILERCNDQYDAVLACGAVLNLPHTINAVHFVHGAWIKSSSHPIRSGVNPYTIYQWLYSRANARWERQALAQATRIVAVSDKIRKELIDAGLPDNRIFTIINGVDINEFHPGSANRSALNLPDDVPLAIFAGDIRSNRKNLDSVLYALTSVPDLHLAVAGSLEGSPYPALAEQLNLTPRVHFLGFRRDMPALMRAADFFTFPSRYEACTLALLEAMASGLPVITAETTGGAELVTEDCGFVLSDPEDIDGLARAMKQLIMKPSLRQSMGRVAREVAEEHSWEKMAEQYRTLLLEAAHSPSVSTS